MGLGNKRVGRLLLLVLLWVWGSLAWADARLLDVHTAAPGSQDISYQRYRLDNGLTLLLHEDHSDPLVHVEVTYHVGSAREVPGMTGFAHLFEHMMFQGSAHVENGQHFALVQGVGGDANGETGRDLTRYYETVPSNQLERVLWLESDRMGFLLPALSQHKFDIQRATVKNEKGQNYDNRPYGRVREQLSAALYPPSHPYAWQPIGRVEDLDRATLGDVQQFFLRWYGPNNATLAIGGDIDVPQTLAWVQRYFGDIQPGPEPTRLAPRPAWLPRTRHLTQEDDIHLPLLYMAIPTVWSGQPDEAALDVLTDRLGGSRTSLLYQRLVKTGLAVSAGANHSCGELACTLEIWAYANAQQDPSLAPLYRQIQQILADPLLGQVSDDGLARIQGRLQASAVWGLESVAGRISVLSSGQALYDDPRHELKALQAMGQVTPEAVQQVYRRYVHKAPAVVLSVVPRGEKSLAAAPEDFIPQAVTVWPRAQGVALPQRPVPEAQRDQPPAAGAWTGNPPPTLWRGSLGQEIAVMGSEQHEIPAISLLLALPGGRQAESPQTLGLAELTARVVSQGSVTLNSEQLSDRLQRLGSSLSLSVGEDYTLVQLSSLTAHLDESLALLQEIWQQPGFREADFARVKAQLLQSQAQARRSPVWLADQTLAQTLYGPQQRQGQPELGSPAQLAGYSLADVQAFYRAHYGARQAKLVVVGDITQAALLPKLAFLGQGPMAGGAGVATPQPSHSVAKPGIYLLDQPGSPQSVIRIGRTALPFDALGEDFLNRLANYPLGGAFNSRLNLRLREQLGYTYGVSAGFGSNRHGGEYVLSTQVRQDATVPAIKEALQLLQEYAGKGPTEAELKQMQQALPLQDAMAYETLGQKAGYLMQLLLDDLPADTARRQQARLAGLDLPPLQQAAARWLDPAQMVIVVVGDAQALEKALAKLHLPLYSVAAP